MKNGLTTPQIADQQARRSGSPRVPQYLIFFSFSKSHIFPSMTRSSSVKYSLQPIRLGIWLVPLPCFHFWVPFAIKLCITHFCYTSLIGIENCPWGIWPEGTPFLTSTKFLLFVEGPQQLCLVPRQEYAPTEFAGRLAIYIWESSNAWVGISLLNKIPWPSMSKVMNGVILRWIENCRRIPKIELWPGNMDRIADGLSVWNKIIGRMTWLRH